MKKNYLAILGIGIGIIALIIALSGHKFGVGAPSQVDELATQPQGSESSIREGWISLNIGAGTSTTYWQQKLADVVIVDYVELELYGSPVNASSTFWAGAGTSTDGVVPVYDVLPFYSVMNLIQIPTSTSAKLALVIPANIEVGTTTPTESALAPVPNYDGLATSTHNLRPYSRLGNNGLGVYSSFPLARNDFIQFHLLDQSIVMSGGIQTVCDSTANRGGVQGFKNCENASSTARGFNAVLNIHYHATTSYAAY